MKIAVCIKHVPVVSRIQFDYETKTIVREGVPSEVNSYDLLGVDKAAQLVQEHGGEAIVFTMGPPAARDSLIQCRAMGSEQERSHLRQSAGRFRHVGYGTVPVASVAARGLRSGYMRTPQYRRRDRTGGS